MQDQGTECGPGVRQGAALVVTTGGLGDAVLFSPVLKAARRVFREVHFLVASDLVRRVYEPAPEVDTVYVVDTNRRLNPRIWLRLAAIGAKLRRSGPPAVAVFASRMNPLLCRIEAVVCGARRLVMEPEPPDALTDLQVNLDLARRLGVDLTPDSAFVPEFPQAARSMTERLTSTGIDRFLVVYPSTPRWNRPQWPCARLAEAARRTAPDTPVVVVGGPWEREQWNREVGPREGFHVFAGELTVEESVEILRRAELAICNDGGMMHVAGALGRPLVGLMLNTSHHHRPPGVATEVVVPKNLACYPCHPRRPRSCPDPAPCIDAVDVDDVVAAARRASATGRSH